MLPFIWCPILIDIQWDHRGERRLYRKWERNKKVRYFVSGQWISVRETIACISHHLPKHYCTPRPSKTSAQVLPWGMNTKLRQSQCRSTGTLKAIHWWRLVMITFSCWRLDCQINLSSHTGREILHFGAHRISRWDSREEMLANRRTNLSRVWAYPSSGYKPLIVRSIILIKPI